MTNGSKWSRTIRVGKKLDRTKKSIYLCNVKTPKLPR